ncbi:hypothetical protein BBAD15_g11571 [Beauveria bassiana D1-5]|uniref:Uncharacterized protein n=1 Tax=Beauveria bassiana D1-5 TaxID=1245745 RepID=A0A0A2VR03_BEABA|nr:hypothetical protein BBAD15_g11571 [Beauveria bassiana D1-5]
MLALLAGAVRVAAHVAQSPLGSVEAVDTTSECRLPPAIDPYEDGLPHISGLWGGRKALSLQVKRLQAVIRVPSVCYDNLGPIGGDERWKPFDELHRVIEGLYPAMMSFLLRMARPGLMTLTAPGAVKNIHTIDERADMHEHIKMLAFYYDLIRNFDGAELEGEAAVAVAEDNEEL